MKLFHTGILIAAISVMLASCNPQSPEQTRVAVVEAEGQVLYQDQINEIIPPNVNEADSIQIAASFIRKWVTDVLLYENAKRNILNKTEIDRLLEDYRKSLIIHHYQQQLLQQRLPATPPEEEIRAFYENFPEQFRAQETLLKGLLLIVPIGAPNLSNVRNWVRSGNVNALEQIEKYSMQNALSYDYFGDRWIQANEILRKLPTPISNPGNFFSTLRYHEEADSTKLYMLGIKDVILPGQAEPFDLAKDNIANTILNKMKSDFLTNFQNELYRDAVEKGIVRFYENTNPSPNNNPNTEN